ncbi:MAG: hypothetical protein H7249_12265 [Chitinophagaceae bacterium]|nr:hypothetical protein [Oligoflexus sp.]
MKRLLLALSLVSAAALAQSAPPHVPAEAPKTPTQFVAQGEAVEIPEAGFTITPPQGWTVIRDGSGASLLFQGPKPQEKPGVVTLQPNIRVMKFEGPRPMDDSTKEEYSKIIVDKNSTLSNRISNYSIRSAERVKLQNGIDAFLFYTEFTFDSTPTMQMHVLVSSASKHFLMTYTDLASVFEKENSPGLAVAYTSMQGVKLDSAPPDRFLMFYYIGAGIAALFVLLLITRIIRGQRMKRLGERIESEDGGEEVSTDDDDDSKSAIAELDDDHDHKSHGTHDDEYDTGDTEEAHHSEEVPLPKTKAAPIPAPKVAVKTPAPKVEVTAPAPVPKVEVKVKVPIPAPAPKVEVKAPKVEAKEKAPAPKPKEKAKVEPVATGVARFEGRVRKNTTSATVPPASQPMSEAPQSHSTPLSAAWNLNESEGHSQDHDDDDDNEREVSAVSHVQPQPIITSASKSKHQKTTPSVRMKEQVPVSHHSHDDEENEVDDGVDMKADESSVARISEILPNTGDTKKKKKGFFGWGKGKKDQEERDDDDGSPDDVPEVHHEEPAKVAKGKTKEAPQKPAAKAPVIQAKSSNGAVEHPVSHVSEVAGDGWNLAEGPSHGNGHHGADSDEEDD